MWFLVSIILLLAHAVVGSPETGSFRDHVSSGEENNSNGAARRTISKSDVHESTIWNGEKLATVKNSLNTANLGKTDLTEIQNSIEEVGLPRNADGSRNRRSIDEIESDMRIMLKRSESVPVGSWLYMPKKENILPSGEGQDLSQEKKSPSFNPWGGKRVTLLRSSPKIRRPIRVPFNSWGGKRGDDDPTSAANGFYGFYGKRSRLLYDPNDRSVARMIGFEAKRVADGGKNGRRVPFNSWGGKRSSYEDLDLDRGSENAIGDGQSQAVKESRTDDDSLLKSVVDKRRRANENYRMRFNSWGGKRSKNTEDVARFYIANNTDNAYPTDQESNEENADREPEESEEPESNDVSWSTIPHKRNLRGQRGTGRFDPWGGKRSSRSGAMLFENDYSRAPPESAGRQVFFPWGG